MPRTLYVARNGQPSRTVLMMIKALGLDDITVKALHIPDGEQRQDWFVKINPRHCLPTLDDNGFALWESRTIMRYLADSAPNGDSVYPKDLQKRALVDRALDEDATYLFKFVTGYVHPYILAGTKGGEEAVQCLHRHLGILDARLKDDDYVAGDSLSIADFSTLSLITLLELTDFDISRHSNVVRWMNSLKAMPFYDVCGEAIVRHREFVESPEWEVQKERRRKAGRVYMFK